jgi:hypothetical protein
MLVLWPIKLTKCELEKFPKSFRFSSYTELLKLNISKLFLLSKERTQQNLVNFVQFISGRLFVIISIRLLIYNLGTD